MTRSEFDGSVLSEYGMEAALQRYRTRDHVDFSNCPLAGFYRSRAAHCAKKRTRAGNRKVELVTHVLPGKPDQEGSD